MSGVTESSGRKSFFSCRKRATIWLSALVIVQLLLYVTLTVISPHFAYTSDGPSRPILSVLGVLGAAFIAYLISIPAALRLSNTRRWVGILLATAVAMRIVVLFSEPIQEVDIYRYIWDGVVSSEGISPYRYAPETVLRGIESSQASYADAELQKLITLASARTGLHDVLQRVHYPELPTVYPPVSQAVFKFSEWLTPGNADVVTRVRVMKAVIVVFDIGVMVLLLKLLRLLAMNPGWMIAYGWSPLVIKEFANSGHLDSIAVFLTLAAVVCAAHAFRANRPTASLTLFAGSAVLLGLAVGAKLYPVVLLPLFACFVWSVRDIRWSAGWVSAAFLSALISVAPMMLAQRAGSDQSATQPLRGLTTFLSQWEMNDLLFMVIQENIKPEGTVPGQPHLWFAVVPNAWRVEMTATASRILGSSTERTPFLMARILTTGVFGLIVLAVCARVWRDPSTFYAGVFLTLAWFWMLSPTQNPWYWTWALPLVMFARCRIWLLVSGLVLIYYLRFWLQYHTLATVQWGFPYQGSAFFDFVVVWFEFAPLLLLLGLSPFVLRRRDVEGEDASRRSDRGRPHLA